MIDSLYTDTTWSRLRRMRQAAQVLFFALYAFLLFAALPGRAFSSFADIFFRFDPLTAIAAMLADRAWIERLAPALFTLGLTFALGRVWCGWVCPMGTLLEWAQLHSARRKTTLAPRWRTVKYILLALIVAAALLSNTSLLIFDPLALLTRTLTTALVPGLNYSITALEHALYPIDFLRPVIDIVEQVLRGPILPTAQSVFELNILFALLFAAILALNTLADRFWCRYLCPLGALLGLVSKISLLRPVVGETCNRCAQCTRVCQPGAIELDRRTGGRSSLVAAAGRESSFGTPDSLSGERPVPNPGSDHAPLSRLLFDYKVVPSECTVCLDCLATCPKDGIEFQWRSWHTRSARFPLRWHPEPAREYDLTRRQALVALGMSATGVALVRTQGQAALSDPLLVRPPGAQDEAAFLSRCLRCSQCMRACPTSGLQPSSTETGLEGIWTPRLMPRLGQCDYGCNACGQVCPSGAIPPLDLASKRQTILGTAVVDRNRCLPWAYGVPCIVCEEMCPTPQKAIRLEQATMLNAQGQAIVVQRPYVLLDICIGCGICEHQCPLAGQAAIRVYRRGNL